MLETMTSGNSPCLNEVLERKTIKVPHRTTKTLGGLVNIFGCQISPTRIVASGPRVLAVERGFESLEALRLGVVNVLGEGDEWRSRRGSVGSRNFEWRTGRWFKGQQLTLLLSAHDRHALLWSSLPLPQDPSVYQLDKPRIFYTHSDPMSFSVWCYFYLCLTHPYSISVTLLSSNPLLSPIAPLDLP